MSDGAARSLLDFPITERFERHSTPNELLLENVVHIAQLGFIFGGEHEFVFLERYVGGTALEVEALANFLKRLIESVYDLG